MRYPIDFHQAICTLERALDFVGIDDISHGRRVGVLCAMLAQRLGWGKRLIHDVFYAGLIHDCGVSTTDEHRQLVTRFDWTGSQRHCQRGAEYLASFYPFAGYADWVRYHHTPWEELENLKNIEPHSRLAANLIFLADRFDAVRLQERRGEPAAGESVRERDAIISILTKGAGHYFAPPLMAVLVEASRHNLFWYAADDYYLDSFVADMRRSVPQGEYAAMEAKPLAQLMSSVVDAKSPFTREHSQKVAVLARVMGEQAGLTAATIDQLEIAALLHDVGKLRVPDQILHKPAALSPDEYNLIKRHSLDSYHLLLSLFGDSDIPRWASMHHEKLDGSGYPFHYTAEDIGIEPRILAVCDVFQALAQQRPYRSPMPLESIMHILNEMVDGRELDRGLVRLLSANRQEFYRYAR